MKIWYEKIATGARNLNIAHKKVQKSSNNFKSSIPMSLVQKKIWQKYGFRCVLWTVLGSHGNAVKMYSRHLFPTEDCLDWLTCDVKLRFSFTQSQSTKGKQMITGLENRPRY